MEQIGSILIDLLTIETYAFAKALSDLHIYFTNIKISDNKPKTKDPGVLVLCQVINDLYNGRGNPVPTNEFTHHLSVDRTLFVFLEFSQLFT